MIDQVPGYRMLERAGEGGFSVVYRARQERLDRVVALKVLSVDAVDDATMRRFERECRITGRLTGHPNVVTVLDTGMTSAGKPFIAMDLFERGSLRDRLAREGPLPLPDVLRAGVKIAGALAATHDAGVLHRDVKPQNILVSKYGEPALADFGVARLVGSSEATHTNAFTPHHAAPEVINGEQPGVTSDVYSLASTMYQLIAGEPAFKAGSSGGFNALMGRILNDPPPPFHRPDLSPRVHEVIAKAMAKAPAERYPSAVAFAGALQRLQSELGLPVTELAAPSGGPSIADVPAEPDHSGFTGPALEEMLRRLAPPHVPAAHPDASPVPAGQHTPPARQPFRVPPPPAPVPSVTATPPAPPPVGFPSVGGQATLPPARDTPTPAIDERPLPNAARPSVPDAPGGRSRRGAVLAGALAAAVAGTAIGVGGFLLVGRDDGTGRGGTSGGSPTPAPSTPARARPSGPAVPLRALRDARPYGLKVVDKGRIVTLSWRLGKDDRYPLWVQQSDGSGTQAPLQALPIGTKRTTLSGLDPGQGYCFVVGAMVAVGQGDQESATVAWSAPVCVRGATAH